jgi:putative oxygen-independent coproporphyrinogen III oxidase
MTLPPLSLYVHIPWCVRKCPYCDFNSHEAARIPEDEYIRALLQDLTRDREMAQGRPLGSVFFGGGTPSLFRARSIGTVLEAADRLIGFSRNVEITLETNPGTAEYDNLAGYKSADVNRISFGVQSFNEDHLRTLGRIHSGDEAQRAYDLARRAGFDNINLDLMHGLPQQTLAQAEADLRQALVLAPEHISWYQLTIEPNTVFFSRPPKLPEDEVLWDIQEAGQAILERGGFAQYEISAYSGREKQARHNLNYWQFGDYLAIGAGAHGKITWPDGAIERYWKTRKPADYLAADKPFTAGQNPVMPEQQMLEFMMNALRLTEGVPQSWFAERTQLSEAALTQPKAELVQRGLMENDPGRLQATALGLRFLNDTLDVFGSL